MRIRSRRRRGRGYNGLWIGTAVALALLSLGDLYALANVDRLAINPPIPLRQPLVAALVVGLALLPAFALRAAEVAVRPRLRLLATARGTGRPPGRRQSSPSRASG